MNILYTKNKLMTIINKYIETFISLSIIVLTGILSFIFLYFLHLNNYFIDSLPIEEISNLIETIDDLTSQIENIDSKCNRFIKTKSNPYSKLYGIFNINEFKLNMPLNYKNNIIFTHIDKNNVIISETNKTAVSEIIKLADYRFISLKYDIYEIINEMIRIKNL
jgi:hypothetical protein